MVLHPDVLQSQPAPLSLFTPQGLRRGIFMDSLYIVREFTLSEQLEA